MLTLLPFTSVHNPPTCKKAVGAETFHRCLPARVCLAVGSKPLVYTLITMIGPWQRATVQLLERKRASLKCPPLNGGADPGCGTFLKMEPCFENGRSGAGSLRVRADLGGAENASSRRRS